MQRVLSHINSARDDAGREEPDRRETGTQEPLAGIGEGQTNSALYNELLHSDSDESRRSSLDGRVQAPAMVPTARGARGDGRFRGLPPSATVLLYGGNATFLAAFSRTLEPAEEEAFWRYGRSVPGIVATTEVFTRNADWTRTWEEWLGADLLQVDVVPAAGTPTILLRFRRIDDAADFVNLAIGVDDDHFSPVLHRERFWGLTTETPRELRHLRAIWTHRKSLPGVRVVDTPGQRLPPGPPTRRTGQLQEPARRPDSGLRQLTLDKLEELQRISRRVAPTWQDVDTVRVVTVTPHRALTVQWLDDVRFARPVAMCLSSEPDWPCATVLAAMLAPGWSTLEDWTTQLQGVRSAGPFSHDGPTIPDQARSIAVIAPGGGSWVAVRFSTHRWFRRRTKDPGNPRLALVSTTADLEEDLDQLHIGPRDWAVYATMARTGDTTGLAPDNPGGPDEAGAPTAAPSSQGQPPPPPPLPPLPQSTPPSDGGPRAAAPTAAGQRTDTTRPPMTDPNPTAPRSPTTAPGAAAPLPQGAREGHPSQPPSPQSKAPALQSSPPSDEESQPPSRTAERLADRSTTPSRPPPRPTPRPAHASAPATRIQTTSRLSSSQQPDPASGRQSSSGAARPGRAPWPSWAQATTPAPRVHPRRVPIRAPREPRGRGTTGAEQPRASTAASSRPPSPSKQAADSRKSATGGTDQGHRQPQQRSRPWRTEERACPDQITESDLREADFIARFDGGAQGGKAGAGVAVFGRSAEGLRVIGQAWQNAGRSTNNVAEAIGLRTATRMAERRALPGQTWTIVGDSQLLIAAINGRYKCNSHTIRAHLKEAIQATKRMREKGIVVSFRWEGRAANSAADALATKAIHTRGSGETWSGESNGRPPDPEPTETAPAPPRPPTPIRTPAPPRARSPPTRARTRTAGSARPPRCPPAARSPSSEGSVTSSSSSAAGGGDESSTPTSSPEDAPRRRRGPRRRNTSGTPRRSPLPQSQSAPPTASPWTRWRHAKAAHEAAHPDLPYLQRGWAALEEFDEPWTKCGPRAVATVLRAVHASLRGPEAAHLREYSVKVLEHPHRIGPRDTLTIQQLLSVFRGIGALVARHEGHPCLRIWMRRRCAEDSEWQDFLRLAPGPQHHCVEVGQVVALVAVYPGHVESEAWEPEGEQDKDDAAGPSPPNVFAHDHANADFMIAFAFDRADAPPAQVPVPPEYTSRVLNDRYRDAATEIGMPLDAEVQGRPKRVAGRRRTVRVGTYNVGGQCRNRIQGLCERARIEKLDVLCVPEPMLKETELAIVGDLAARSGFQLWTAAPEGRRAAGGVAVLVPHASPWRPELLEKDTAGRGARICLRLGNTLVVCLYVPHDRDACRDLMDSTLGQIELLREKFPVLRHTILAGDLNAQAGARRSPREQGVWTACAAAGLVVPQDDLEPTCFHTGKPSRVDHILLSSELQTLTSWVQHDWRGHTAARKHYHAALVCRVRLPDDSIPTPTERQRVSFRAARSAPDDDPRWQSLERKVISALHSGEARGHTWDSLRDIFLSAAKEVLGAKSPSPATTTFDLLEKDELAPAPHTLWIGKSPPAQDPGPAQARLPPQGMIDPLWLFDDFVPSEELLRKRTEYIDAVRRHGEAAGRDELTEAVWYAYAQAKQRDLSTAMRREARKELLRRHRHPKDHHRTLQRLLKLQHAIEGDLTTVPDFLRPELLTDRTDDEDAAREYAEHLEAAGTSGAQPQATLPFPAGTKRLEIGDGPGKVSLDDIKMALYQACGELDASTAVGVDSLEIRWLQRMSPEGREHVCATVASLLLGEGATPPPWWLRTTIVTPVPKTQSGAPSDARPIAVASQWARWIARAIMGLISEHLEDTGALSPHQGGFRPGRRGTAPIAAVQALAGGKRGVLVLALDLSSAYDRVHRTRTLQLLTEAGIDPSLREVLDQLWGVATLVKVGGALRLVGAGGADEPPGGEDGAPGWFRQARKATGLYQGSPASPTAFDLTLEPVLRFVNRRQLPYWRRPGPKDFAKPHLWDWEDTEAPELGGTIVRALAFADDLLAIASTLEELQAVADALVMALQLEGFNLNPSKSRAAALGRGVRPEGSVVVRDAPTPIQPSLTYLGTRMVKALTWREDAAERAKSALGAMGLVRAMRALGAPVAMIADAAESYCMSHLAYGWEVRGMAGRDVVERTEETILRSVAGGLRGTPIGAIRTALGWPSAQERWLATTGKFIVKALEDDFFCAIVDREIANGRRTSSIRQALRILGPRIWRNEMLREAVFPEVADPAPVETPEFVWRCLKLAPVPTLGPLKAGAASAMFLGETFQAFRREREQKGTLRDVATLLDPPTWRARPRRDWFCGVPGAEIRLRLRSGKSNSGVDQGRMAAITLPRDQRVCDAPCRSCDDLVHHYCQCQRVAAEVARIRTQLARSLGPIDDPRWMRLLLGEEKVPLWANDLLIGFLYSA